MTQTTNNLRDHVQRLNADNRAKLEQALRFALYHYCEFCDETLVAELLVNGPPIGFKAAIEHMQNRTSTPKDAFGYTLDQFMNWIDGRPQ